MMNRHTFQGHDHAAAAYYTYDDGAVDLVSYTTCVAEVDADGWLTVHGLYSMTTRRHLSWFMGLFHLTYQHARDLYEDNMQMNVYTGEVRPA